MMTRQDLLSGKSFVYNGSFHRLTSKGLKYEPIEGKVFDTTKDEAFWLNEPSCFPTKTEEEHFMLFSSKFGKIPLEYAKCKLLNMDLYEQAKKALIQKGVKEPSDALILERMGVING